MTTIDRPPHLIDALHDLDQHDGDNDYLQPGENAPEPGTEYAEPAPERRQPGHLIELFVAGEEPYRVRVLNRDKIAYDQARAKRRDWPSPDDARYFAMTFWTWSAAKRAGRTSVPFAQWQELLEDFDLVTEVSADPTQ